VKSGLARKMLRLLPSTLFERLYVGYGSVLLYHRVDSQPLQPFKYCDPSFFAPCKGLLVSAERFEEQISYLSKNYECLGLADLVSRSLNTEPIGKLISVTFDDGYLDNFEVALPILERYGVPATIFVTSDLIEGSTIPWWFALEDHILQSDKVAFDWKGTRYEFSLSSTADRYRCWDRLYHLFRSSTLKDSRELIELLKLDQQGNSQFARFPTHLKIKEFDRHPLIDIQPHSSSHPVLALETPGDAESQIRGSKEYFESLLEKSCNLFAYPFGDPASTSKREVELAKKLGFSIAVTSNQGHIREENLKSLYSLPRINIDYFDDLSRFIDKLKGLDFFIRTRAFSVDGDRYNA